MPVLNRIAKKYSPNVVVLAVNVGEDESTYKSYINSSGFSHLLWARDSKQSVSQDYQVRGIPALYVVDTKGVIRYRHIGYSSSMESQVISEIKTLLNN